MVSQETLIATIAIVLCSYGIEVTNCNCGSMFGQPDVLLSNGVLTSKNMTADDGTQYCGFTGIRYAQPPTGILRFRPPLPFLGTTGIQVLESSDVMCPQPTTVPVLNENPTTGIEDCLLMDVYTPNVIGSLPVIVFIHGGWFASGNGMALLYGSQRYLRHNVVLVTFNYRLGILGFLSTGDNASPGNYGLLDQIMALEWVHNNIAKFGGNPNSVTLVGESAGAMSAHLLSLSPLSAGLFNRLILESGSALCNEATQPQPLVYATNVANSVGCPTTNTSIMVDCLRLQPVLSLFNNTTPFEMQFWPVVDGVGIDRVMPQKPIDILTSGNYIKYPTVIGFNKDEGLYFYNEISPPVTLENFDDMFPKVLLMATNFKLPQYIANVTAAVKNQYLSNVTTDSEFYPQFIKILSDSIITVASFQAAQLMAQAGVPVYPYVFIYKGIYSATNSQASPTQGVSHADELIYLFFLELINQLPPADYQMSLTLVDMWVNFATIGIPTLDNSWPSSANGQLQYLSINSTLQLVDPNNNPYLSNDQVSFWESLDQFKMQ